MNRFLFVLGSNWQLSIAELDQLLKHSRYEGRIVDYSANVAIVEFDKLFEKEYYINYLQDIQFILGGCQKIVKLYDFIHIQTIREAFPFNIGKFSKVEKARKKINDKLKKLLVGRDGIFPKVYEDIFFAVSIYPNFYDDDYYKKILVKHFLPFLNENISKLAKKKGTEKAIYFRYPRKNIRRGDLNPIFPHHFITYELFKENRAEIIFGFTEEGVYIGRTFTSDDPNFKRKIDEKRPFKDFKSAISPKLALMMLNFLNLFERREEKKVLDPFVGNGMIALWSVMQGFKTYGSDIDNTKITHTIRNINWMLELLEEPMIPFINNYFLTSDVSQLSKKFESEFFD
ncbi:MAG: hypothetical protein EU544_03180, partial [Promethearchaeota archaeon]